MIENELFRNVEPGQAFNYRGRELRRVGNGQWASDVRGNLWMMSPGDKVMVEPQVAPDDEDEPEMLYPFNVFP
jgi:hypothetical protein